jgi:3-oxoacyl-[acyl-carrier-protein] synthase-3
MRSQFESFGVYTPATIQSTLDLMNKLENKPELDLQRITGIKNRRHRADGEDSLTIALAAAKSCLKNSKYKAEDLDIIINTAITRFKGGLTFYLDPPISFWLKKQLGADKAMNFDITNACAGMMTGAYILDNMIKAGIVRNGMVVSGECITPIADNAVKEIKKGIDPQFASLTVGDAGAAFIMDKSADNEVGIEAIELLTFARHAELCFGMPSEDHPGVAMYTDAMGIHGSALATIPMYLRKFLERNNLKIEDYDIAIPHQTSTKAIKMGIDGIRNAFNKKPEDMPEILVSVDEYGNTASTAIIVALYNAIKEKRVKEGTKVAFIALASGLVLGFITAKLGNIQVKEETA